MIRVTLSTVNKKKILVELKKNTANKNLRNVTKLQAILAVTNGFSCDEIAAVINYSVEMVRDWVNEYLRKGLRFLQNKKSPGRPPKLSPEQKLKLKEMITNGPLLAGFDGGCWRAPMIQHLIEKKFGVKIAVKYLPEFLNSIGLSYQKAKFSADHKSPEKRSEWLNEIWPQIINLSNEKKSQILFGDEASFPQWGSLSYTWAPKGEQPVVETSGCRKGHKVFGLIDYNSGSFYHKEIEGKFNSLSYIEFLKEVLTQTSGHIILIQDGAPYHRSAEVKAFFKENEKRLAVFQLPSYSPDYNPIEKLWKKIKQKGVHLVYFPDFQSLKDKVNKMLNVFSKSSSEVLSLFGFYDELTIGVRKK